MTALTVFTPVYNGGDDIRNLYECLRREAELCPEAQFEWLVVDDGSTDGTGVWLDSVVDNTPLNMRVIHQPNGGKHSAINHGVRKAEGEFFFTVDADDLLPSGTIRKVLEMTAEIALDPSFAGIAGTRVHFDGSPITTGFKSADQVIDATAIEIRYRHGIEGHVAEIYRTDVLRLYPFPYTEGESFCPESLVWNRIARTGLKLRYTATPFYRCEYSPRGLMANLVQVRHRSPRASDLYYSELASMPGVPWYMRIKAAINYHRFVPKGKSSMRLRWLPTIPAGRFMRVIDRLRKRL